MTSRGNRRWFAVLATWGVLASTASCSSGSAGSGTASDPASSPTSSPTSVRVPTTTPTVEPADGPLVKTQGATIRGLPTYRRVSDFGVVQGYRDDQSAMTFGAAFSDAKSIDAFARQQLRVSDHPDDLERVDDVVVGGKYNAWHMLDTRDPQEETHLFGVLFLGGSWTIEITFYERGRPQPLTADEREQTIASILASFEPTFN
jgi:hypothetical protein